MITYFIVFSMIFITHAQTSPSHSPPPQNFVLLCDILFTLCHAKNFKFGCVTKFCILIGQNTSCGSVIG